MEIFFCYCQSRAIGDVVRHRRRNTLAAQNLFSARKGNVIQDNGKSDTNMQLEGQTYQYSDTDLYVPLLKTACGQKIF